MIQLGGGSARAATWAVWAGLSGVGSGAVDAGRVAAPHDAAPPLVIARPWLQDSLPLVIARPWLPLEAVAVALPPPATGGRDTTAVGEGLADQATFRALLAAARQATAGRAATVDMERDDAGRYLVTTAPTEDANAVRGVLEHLVEGLVEGRLPAADLVAGETSATAALAFGRDSPRARFDAAFRALLNEIRPDTARLRPPAWVLVRRDRAERRGGFPLRTEKPLSPETPPLLLSRARRPASDSAKVARRHLRAEVVTTWVGSVYRLPPETTLVQAQILRTVLEDWLEPDNDPSVYEFSTEIGREGRIFVRFSATPEAAAAWEDRLDQAFSDLAGQEHRERIRALLRRARGRWSRRLADAGGVAVVAASALARGASSTQAAIYVRDLSRPLPPEEIATAARGARLSARLVYGT